MGVNFPDFLSEANRLLKPGATLYIAEVLNRFTDAEEFVTHMKKYSGFELVKKTKIGDYKTNVQESAPTAFYVFKFTKTGKPLRAPESYAKLLKPCFFTKRYMS